MPHPARKAYSFAGLALLAVGIAASCSAGGEDTKHTGATSTRGAGGGGGDGALTTGSDGPGGFSSGGITSGGCQQFAIAFEPQTPTVMVLVDRSGSMFDSGFWDPLKTAVLKVVEKTQDKVRYGLLTFTGIAGQECPLVTGTNSFALNSYASLKTAYDAASIKPGAKLETPTGMVINEKVIPDLLAFKEPGKKYILFVTDGEPDRCDDGNPVCARDDVVGAVQSAFAQSIGTFVFGLQANAALGQHLQDVANAGAGQAVMTPGDALVNGCLGGDATKAKGKYAAAGGTTKFFTPDATDATALENALSAAVAGAQSCTFDLQGKIEVDLANAGLGHVLIDGKAVPYNAQNGWQMTSPTQLELVGDACSLLKNATMGISFDFPCDIIIAK
jgi:von Willebrand factor type A domain